MCIDLLGIDLARLTFISLLFVLSRLTVPVLSVERMPLRSSEILSDLNSTPNTPNPFRMHRPNSELLSFYHTPPLTHSAT